jgi:predicted transposase/invertase (TIGR01784 family)
MAEIKNSMDRAQELLIAQEEAQERGLEKGIQKGRAEGILEIARKMKEMGDPIEKIQTITGLQKETIEQL